MAQVIGAHHNCRSHPSNSMATGLEMTRVPLSWSRLDPERWFGLRGGRFTRVNSLFALIVSLVLTLGFYWALIPLERTYFAEMFTQRGPVPYCIVALSFWSLVILFLKRAKLRGQRR